MFVLCTVGCRKELKQLWDKCFFGEDERREFTPAFDGMSSFFVKFIVHCM